MKSLRRTAKLAVAISVLTTMLVVSGSNPASTQAVLPSGFSLQRTDTGLGQFDLTDFTFLPSGDLLAIGKTGQVVRVPHGGGGPVVVATIDVFSAGDLGLVGLALSHDYASSGEIFVTYNYEGTPYEWQGQTKTATARASVLTVDDIVTPTALTNERVLLDGLRAPSEVHSIGQITSSPDGALYIASGDGGSWLPDPDALRAQRLDSPYGRILRIDRDGNGVPGNPFYDASNADSWASRTYANGLRNPFRFSFRPSDGALYVGDVGWVTYEEVNVVTPGANYGWPCWEGPERQRNPDTSFSYQQSDVCKSLYEGTGALEPVEPIWSYGHVGSESVTGGVFYEGSSYPEQYRGAYFFGDYAKGAVWTLETGSDNQLVRGPEGEGSAEAPGVFGRQIGAPVRFRTGPDGDVHWADILSGEIVRLTYDADSTVPEAAATAAVVGQEFSVDVQGLPPLAVDFDAAESVSRDGTPLTYSWDFGDGATGSGVAPQHTYVTSGTFAATVTVANASNESSTATVTIRTDNSAPELAVTAPDKTFAVGERTTLTATSSDAQQPEISGANVRWAVDVRHCSTPSSCHIHPGVRSSGASLQLDFPDHGPDAGLQVTATVVDAQRATTKRQFELRPSVRTLTLASNPPGVAGVTGHVRAVVGANVSLFAPATSASGAFRSWSDGGERTRSYKMPGTDTTLVAEYEGATPPLRDGYRLVADDGGVFTFGNETFHGSAGGVQLNAPVVGGARTASRNGYWLAASDGGVFAYGDAQFSGSMGGQRLNAPIVDVASTPSGGYWLVASDGGVFAFGGARFHGSMGGAPLNEPVVAGVATPTGNGYWLIASDGGVFAFGDARFSGSTGGSPLNAPIVDAAATSTAGGYWLAAADGGVFAFGDARFAGSMGGTALNAPVVAVKADEAGGGYRLVGRDGGVFAFGGASYLGSAAGLSRSRIVAQVG